MATKQVKAELLFEAKLDRSQVKALTELSDLFKKIGSTTFARDLEAASRSVQALHRTLLQIKGLGGVEGALSGGAAQGRAAPSVRPVIVRGQIRWKGPSGKFVSASAAQALLQGQQIQVQADSPKLWEERLGRLGWALSEGAAQTILEEAEDFRQLAHGVQARRRRLAQIAQLQAEDARVLWWGQMRRAGVVSGPRPSRASYSRMLPPPGWVQTPWRAPMYGPAGTGGPWRLPPGRPRLLLGRGPILAGPGSPETWDRYRYGRPLEERVPPVAHGAPPGGFRMWPQSRLLGPGWAAATPREPMERRQWYGAGPGVSGFTPGVGFWGGKSPPFVPTAGPLSPGPWAQMRWPGPPWTVQAGQFLKRYRVPLAALAMLGGRAAGQAFSGVYSGPQGIGAIGGAGGTLFGAGGGAAIGGTLGLLGGPFAPITVPAGLLFGGLIGGGLGGGIGGAVGRGVQTSVLGTGNPYAIQRAAVELGQFLPSAGMGPWEVNLLVRGATGRQLPPPVSRTGDQWERWVTGAWDIANQIRRNVREFGFGPAASLQMGLAAGRVAGGAFPALFTLPAVLSRAYGLGPQVAGGFGYGMRRGAGTVRIGNDKPLVAAKFAIALEHAGRLLGLSPVETGDLMTYASQQMLAHKQTGIPFDISGFYHAAAAVGGGVPGLAFAKGMRSYGAELATAGPGGPLDVYALMTLGGLGQGPITPVSLRGALLSMELQRYAPGGVRRFIGGFARMFGGGEQGEAAGQIMLGRFFRRTGIGGLSRAFVISNRVANGEEPTALPEDLPPDLLVGRARALTSEEDRRRAGIEADRARRGTAHLWQVQQFEASAQALLDALARLTPIFKRMADLFNFWAE